MNDDHRPPQAMDFNVPVVPITHAADRQRLRDTFGDEWECMHRQAIKIATVTPLSYSQAVDRIIRRETYQHIVIQQPRRQGHTATMEAFEQFGLAWTKLVKDLGTVLEPFARRLEPPANVMERALQARKNRHTGPARPTGQAARRPRRHQ